MAGKTRQQQQNTNQGSTATKQRRSTRAAPAEAASTAATTAPAFVPATTSNGYRSQSMPFAAMGSGASWAVLEYLATGAHPTAREIVAAFANHEIKLDPEAVSTAIRAMGGRNWIEHSGKGLGTRYQISDAGRAAWGIVRRCEEDLANLRK